MCGHAAALPWKWMRWKANNQLEVATQRAQESESFCIITRRLGAVYPRMYLDVGAPWLLQTSDARYGK